MVNDYKVDTKFNFLETKQALRSEFEKWGVTDWIVAQVGNAVRLNYMIKGREVELLMDKQATPKDNIRVLYLVIQSLRLNDVRGMGEVMASAYMQIAAPSRVLDPYDVLGLPRGTALPVCEAQWKEMMKKYHPDRAGGSAQKTKELNDAIVQIRKDAK